MKSQKAARPVKKEKLDTSTLKTILKSSYQSNRDAEKELAQKGFTLDKELSGQRAKVFTSPSGKPHIVYRGTQNRHDVLTDAALALRMGRFTNRAKHTQMVNKQVEKKYGRPAAAYGHSLGGWLAENSGAKGGVVTFNKASNGSKVHNKNQVDVRTHNDPVSMLTPKGGTHQIQIRGKKNLLKTHSYESLR